MDHYNLIKINLEFSKLKIKVFSNLILISLIMLINSLENKCFKILGNKEKISYNYHVHYLYLELLIKRVPKNKLSKLRNRLKKQEKEVRDNHKIP